MAKNNIQYVHLEAGAFISDVDYQSMTAEQRGVYCSIIFYLYANDGKLDISGNPDLFSGNNVISLLSNCQKTGEEWERVWSGVKKKFKIKNNILTHKRVTSELRRSAKYRNQKSLAGKKGMQQRYNSVSSDDITKSSQGNTKSSKGNIDILQLPKNSPDSMKLGLEIAGLIESEFCPFSEKETKTFQRIARHLAIVGSSLNGEFIPKLKELIRLSKQDHIKKPKAMFVELCKKETGYEPTKRIL